MGINIGYRYMLCTMSKFTIRNEKTQICIPDKEYLGDHEVKEIFK